MAAHGFGGWHDIVTVTNKKYQGKIEKKSFFVIFFGSTVVSVIYY